MAIKFYYNGIKVDGGKLQKCSYFDGPYLSLKKDTITITGKRYKDFCSEIHKAFTLENDSDFQSDYFTNDKIIVSSNHPLFNDVYEAMEQATKKREIKNEKRDAKRKAA